MASYRPSFEAVWDEPAQYISMRAPDSLHKGPVFYLTRKLYAYVINIKD